MAVLPSCLCAPHADLVHAEVRRGCWIPGAVCDFQHYVVPVPPSVRAANAAEPSLSPGLLCVLFLFSLLSSHLLPSLLPFLPLFFFF